MVLKELTTQMPSLLAQDIAKTDEQRVSGLLAQLLLQTLLPGRWAAAGPAGTRLQLQPYSWLVLTFRQLVSLLSRYLKVRCGDPRTVKVHSDLSSKPLCH